MQALTAFTRTAADRRWVEPIYLLTLTLYRDRYGASPTSVTVRLSDRARYVLDQEWLPLVQSWGDVGEALAPLEGEASLGAMEVVLANTIPVAGAARVSDLIRHGANTGGYDLAASEATLTMVFAGGAASDAVTLYRLAVDEVVELTEETISLRLAGIELALEDRDDLLRIDTVTFPLADPDAVGQVVPILCGTLQGLPALCVVGGIVERLRVAITASSPGPGGELLLSDVALVARLPTSGTLQIDAEQISYTGRDSVAAKMTGITRGAAGTTATAHTGGTAVVQVLSEYVYVCGENRGAHLTQAVTAVRVDGMLVTSGYTVTLADTSLVAGRSLVVLRFTVRPVITKQVHVSLLDTIAVQDGIGVSDALTVSDTIAMSTVARETLEQHTTTTLPHLLGPGGYSRFFYFPELPAGGTVEQVVVDIGLAVTVKDLADPPIHGTYVEVSWLGQPDITIWRTSSTGVVEINTGGLTELVQGASAYQSSIHVQATGSTDQLEKLTIMVGRCTQSVRRLMTINKSGAASRGGAVTKTGTASKAGTVTLTGNSAADTVIGAVTVDVQGLRDDGSGTVSGTPSLLLANPTDVWRLLMREVYRESSTGLYDAASWASTRASHASAGYVWACAFRGGLFSSVRRLAGLQARADLSQDSGLWRWVYRQAPTTAVMALDSRTLLGPPVFGWTPRTDLVTRVVARYDPGEGLGDLDDSASEPGWRRTLSVQSAQALRDRYGSLIGRGPDDARRVLDLPWVADAATAAALAAYWLSQWEVPRLTLRARLPWVATGMDKADAIRVVSSLMATYGGQTQTPVFLVRSLRRYVDGELGDVIEVEAVEAGLINVPVSGELADLAETLTVADQVTVVVRVTFADGVTWSDAVTIRVSASLADTWTLGDAVSVVVRAALADALTLGDAVSVRQRVHWDQPADWWEQAGAVWDAASEDWDRTSMLWDQVGVTWD